MKFPRFLAPSAALVAVVAAALIAVKAPVHSADSPATNARPSAKISDVYLFPSPTNSNNVVAVMNVNPGLAAGTLATAAFDQSVLYQMKFDTRVASEAAGSAPAENLVIQFSVGQSANGTQQILVYGPTAPVQVGPSNSLVNGGAISGSGLLNSSFTTNTGLTVFAGLRADPQFFDRTQFLNLFPDRAVGAATASCLPAPAGNGTCAAGWRMPGIDTQAATNVLSLVVEMPKTVLFPSGPPGRLAYWATSSTATGQ